MLTSTNNCRNGTIFDSLRNITQKGKDKTRQMNPGFFHLLFELKLLVIFIFVFENCQNSFSWGPPFGSFWSAKYQNFGGESCEIRMFPLDSGNIHIEKSKKPGFFYWVENKFQNFQSNLMVKFDISIFHSPSYDNFTVLTRKSN